MQFKCIDIFDNGGKREYRFSLPVEHDATARYKLGRSYDFIEGEDYDFGTQTLEIAMSAESIVTWLNSSPEGVAQLMRLAAEHGIVLESQQKPSAGDTPSKIATAVQTGDKAGKSK